MSLGKKGIIVQISSEAGLTLADSKSFLDKFIGILKKQKTTTKIKNFGTFYRFNTPQRIGRNPKNKKEYLIKSKNKLGLRASKHIKNILN